MNNRLRDGEIFLSKVLRLGLLLASLTVIFGGILFLLQHGDEVYDFHVFKGDMHHLANFDEIARGILHYEGLAVMQAGLLLLIATPVARVAGCIIMFVRQRDYLYIGISSTVLLILLYSLFWR
jgi:uncharacterized membrane protein